MSRLAFLPLLLLSACTSAPPPAAQAAAPAEAPKANAVAEAVAAKDRDANDRALDPGRKPVETFSFFGIAPGQRVAELQAGGGYSAEILARIVGPSGKVYAQNSKLILEKFAEKPWSLRLQKPVMANVVRVDEELEQPLPAEAKDLDAVLMILFYHDTVWMNVDRPTMNKAIFASLKKGGVYGIVDHAGRAGTGTTEAQTLHRIDEKVVRDEVLAAGFQLAGEGDFLRNPADTKDWSASPGAAGDKRGTSDRFVLKFVKP